MAQAITPFSRLFDNPRRDDSLVATGLGRQHDWQNFTGDVAGLASRITDSGGNRWLVADADAYALAVGVFAVLQADCVVMLPANLEQGHLVDLAATADGLISSTESVDATNWLKTFDSSHSGDVVGLHALDSENAATLLHTSGSTGVPLAVHKPLRCLEAEIAANEEAFAPPAGCMVLATVPPYHIYGLLYRVLWPLATQRPFSTEVISYPEELHSALREHSGCILVSSPAFLRRALPALDLEQLKKFLGPVFSSGGPLPPAVAAEYNSITSTSVTEVYGSTETGGIAYRSVTDPEKPALWQPFPTVEIDVTPDQQSLSIRSPMLPVIDWTPASDRVRIHTDGHFELLGRADRIVKIEEKRVSLPEVEQRLGECPSVEAVRVIQLPGEDDKRQILAAVIEPTAAGWEILTEDGRQKFIHLLREILKPYLAAIVLPRKWRFVTQIPEDDRGKTSNAALTALFDKNQRRTVEPVVIDRKSDTIGVTLHLHLRKDLFYFEGHFDKIPILAGVVQIDWAIGFAKEHFLIPGCFQRIEALKFSKVLMAGDDVDLHLNYDQTTTRLKFRYGDAVTKYSSGRIVFGAEP